MFYYLTLPHGACLSHTVGFLHFPCGPAASAVRLAERFARGHLQGKFLFRPGPRVLPQELVSPETHVTLASFASALLRFYFHLARSCSRPPTVSKTTAAVERRTIESKLHKCATSTQTKLPAGTSQASRRCCLRIHVHRPTCLVCPEKVKPFAN